MGQFMGSKAATVKDIVEVRKCLSMEIEELECRMLEHLPHPEVWARLCSDGGQGDHASDASSHDALSRRSSNPIATEQALQLPNNGAQNTATELHDEQELLLPHNGAQNSATELHDEQELLDL